MSGEGMGRACICGKASKGAIRKEDCPFCWLWINSLEYRAARSRGKAARPGKPAKENLCLFLGERIEALEGGLKLEFCQTCSNGAGRLLPVFACLHPEQGPETVRETKCRNCPSFELRKPQES